MLELIDRITQQLDKGKTPINVYLDLSKAFDTLDHNILLHKLKYYGIEGTALCLFESYLNERQQYVDFEVTPSNCNRILTGVPQGSVLGPLLFIIYINDIARSSKHFNFIIYADDTTLCSTLKVNTDATQLNMELNNVSRWLNLKKLSLNVKKTKAMAFQMPQNKIIQPNIQINGSNIEFVDNFVFLGITINNKLNWNSHINKVTNKISKTVGILNKLRSFLPSGVLQTIYNTLILPHMTYRILAWGRHTNTIHTIQKRAIRIIAASKYNAHTEPLFKQLNLLRACDICKLQELKFYHKLINRQLPKYFESFVYQTNLDLHKYNTRRGHRLHIPRINHAFAQLNIRHSVIQTVNSIPDNVSDKIRTHSLKGFSTYAKNYFISKYETTCEIANVMYVYNKPSQHINLRDLLIYLLNLFIALNNLIISYIPFIAMYKQLNLVPIINIVFLCLVLMGLRCMWGAGAAGCLLIGGCSTVVAPRWIWSCHVWKHC